MKLRFGGNVDNLRYERYAVDAYLSKNDYFGFANFVCYDAV